MIDEKHLGRVAHDRVTGFESVITHVTYWLNGCVRIGLQPRHLKDGKTIDPHVFDQQQLVLHDGPNIYNEGAPTSEAPELAAQPAPAVSHRGGDDRPSATMPTVPGL